VPAEAASALDAAIGLHLEGHEPDGTAVLRLDPPPLAFGGGDPPFLHGGALATCVDTAGWYAVVHARPGSWVAVDLRVDFLRLARPVAHRVTGRCLRAGRTLAVADVAIAPLADPERLVAVGRVQFARVAGDAPS